MGKLIVICGPTATGKTKLGLYLADVLKGEIVSADSRQVYRGLTIGTGKEYSSNPRTPIWGYDLVDPTDDYSVSEYEHFATAKIAEIVRHRNIPIVVGGTGLYIKAVVDGIATAVVPQDKDLRGSLINKSSQDLFDMLLSLDREYALSLNNSDKHNARRLIRAIEIARAGVSRETKESRYDALFIGLTSSRDVLYKRIEMSVHKRVERGVEVEIEQLRANGVSWDDQSMSSLGYRQWRGYFEGTKTKDQVILEWIHEEQQYIKRQLTWFKKDSRIHWFDIENENSGEKVIQLCQEFIQNA